MIDMMMETIVRTKNFHNFIFTVATLIGFLLTVSYGLFGCSGGEAEHRDETVDSETEVAEGSERKDDLSFRVSEMYEAYKAEDFADVRDISAEEIIREGNTDGAADGESQLFLLLDCRTRSERAVSMLPGALSQEEFESSRDHYAGRKIAVYCTIGYRSGLYARELKGEGVNAFNLRGGVLSWAIAGGEFVDPATGEDTKRVHVYGKKWDLLPPGYEAVY